MNIRNVGAFQGFLGVGGTRQQRCLGEALGCQLLQRGVVVVDLTRYGVELVSDLPRQLQHRSAAPQPIRRRRRRRVPARSPACPACWKAP